MQANFVKFFGNLRNIKIGFVDLIAMMMLATPAASLSSNGKKPY
jgi:hypothetical protein